MKEIDFLLNDGGSKAKVDDGSKFKGKQQQKNQVNSLRSKETQGSGNGGTKFKGKIHLWY